jgi:hypothetical protein
LILKSNLTSSFLLVLTGLEDVSEQAFSRDLIRSSYFPIPINPSTKLSPK